MFDKLKSKYLMENSVLRDKLYEIVGEIYQNKKIKKAVTEFYWHFPLNDNTYNGMFKFLM